MMAPSRLQSWKELSLSARTFISTVCAIGAVITAYALPVAFRVYGFQALALAVAAIPASMVKATFPHGLSTLTLGLLLDYLAILVLGPHAAVLVAAVGAWGQCTFRSRVKNPAHQTLFSVFALVAAVFAAGQTYVAFGGHPGTWDPSAMFLPLAATATVFFVLNSGLVAVAIGLTSGQSTVRVWSDTFLWIWPSYLLGAAVAAAIFSGVRQGNLWAVAFLAVPLALTIRNLQAYFERERDSITDSGTGLPNRRHILQYATRELARARRRASSLALVLIDLDGFKAINDLHGHRVGDAALRQVAECLQRSIRAYDMCGRYGGDEFLVVLSEGDAAAAGRLEVDLQAAVGALQVRVSGTELSLKISTGSAEYPQEGETLDDLLDVADARMYRCKLGREGPEAAPAGAASDGGPRNLAYPAVK